MDNNLLAVLACPLCKGSLIWDKPKQVLICELDKLAYPITDDIPVLIVEEAQSLAKVMENE